jgi:hypothetical protein
MAAAEYAWDVFVPGEDLPRRITTDYVVTDGDLVTVGGRRLLVERVELPDDPDEDVVPVVHVSPPHEPAA